MNNLKFGLFERKLLEKRIGFKKKIKASVFKQDIRIYLKGVCLSRGVI